jgi:aminopeptidase
MAQRTASHEILIERYLDVLLRVGVNIQSGQTLLVVDAPLATEAIPVVHRLIERAYALGAGEVLVSWKDATTLRQRALHATEAALHAGPIWQGREMEDLLRSGAAYLRFDAPDAETLAGAEPARVATIELARRKAFDAATKLRTAGTCQWCIAGLPTRAWARLVFPQLSERAGLAALWRMLFRVSRASAADPIAAWREHQRRLEGYKRYLNMMRFKRLRYRAPGTDLTIELPEGHLWHGGGTTARGVSLVPNIPTEEVFSLPRRDGVNGTVSSTLPLNLGGQQIIRRLALTFDQGRIVDYAAETGHDALASVVETDDGSHYLGEVALVPITSPCNTGFPLYSTLYDENASCHLAIGQAYPTCLEGAEGASERELAARGANSSLQHVDFMIGSDSLDIDGETVTDEVVPIFRHGTWAPNVRMRAPSLPRHTRSRATLA